MNFRIRVPRIRCVDAAGNMLGLMNTRDALVLAQQAGLDLVEIAPNADPPVCRIMDFGKFQYEQNRKSKEARKSQHNRPAKEVKFHSSVAEHDYMTKVGHIRNFLENGHKVKLTLTFRGRENAHRELGFELIKRVIVDTADIGQVEMDPRLFGRAIQGMIAPRSVKQQVVGAQISAGRPKTDSVVSAPAIAQSPAPVVPPSPATPAAPVAPPAAPVAPAGTSAGNPT